MSKRDQLLDLRACINDVPLYLHVHVLCVLSTSISIIFYIQSQLAFAIFPLTLSVRLTVTSVEISSWWHTSTPPLCSQPSHTLPEIINHFN